jgi:cytochrome c oxidase cbb3-type subunit 3
VKYGVPEKGMIAWQASMKPNEIQNVSNYILSIQGSNPPNAKAAQGEKIATKTDSTSHKPVATL